jgi:hypothetical protein
VKLLEQFWSYLKEREQIRLNRLAGLPRESWTADLTMQKYSFTNVKRIHDRTTTLLRQEFYEPRLKNRFRDTDLLKAVLLNATIFRYFGCIETARVIGWSGTWDQARHDFIQMRGLCDELRFTAAYIVPSCGRSEPKYEVVLDIINSLWGAFDGLLKQHSWEEWSNNLSSCYGCGSFMAKEILLDFIMATGDNPSDWETWTPVGPGARRGAARIRDGYLDRGLNEYESLQVIREVYATRADFWPKHFHTMIGDQATMYDAVTLELTDIQFAFCEFDKYSRVAEGRRPKRNFRPTIDDVTRKIADS